MYQPFGIRIQEARQVRAQTELPNVRSLVLWTVLGVLGFIVFSLLMAPHDRGLEYHFVSERGLVTAMSAILLSAAGAFCLAALAIQIHMTRPYTRLWVLMTLGFVFLALDETAQFHERVGNVLDDQYSSGVFRNWNDMVVILYGIIALPVAAMLLPDLLRYPLMLEGFVVAFLFYVLHTLIDSTAEPETTVSIIFEESAKLCCGATFAMTTFVGFQTLLRNSTSTPEPRG